METYNLHTHSFYCGHGSGTIADYVKVAKEEKLSVLGFSEHCPVPGDRWRTTRMALSSRPLYERDVREAKEGEGKDGLKILLGYECDYYPEYDSYFRDLRQQCDYLIAAVHFAQTSERADIQIHKNIFDKKMLHAYADQYITSLETGLFLIGAHPDLFALAYRVWDDEAIAVSRAILSAAESLGVPLEVNAYGLRKPLIETPTGPRRQYPILPFWNLAREYKVSIVASADAHKSEMLRGFLPLCENFLSPTGLHFAPCPYREKGEKA